MLTAAGIAVGSFGWAELKSEKAESAEAVSRLLADLSAGADQLELDRERTASAHQAIGRLIEDLALPHGAVRSEQEILQDFLTAARAGYYDFLLDHDASFQQLQASSRLDVIKDAEVAATLIQYYRQIEHIKSLWSSIPPAVTQRFQRLTGEPAIALESAGELPHELRQQVVDALHDRQFLGDLRELNAMLSMMVMHDMLQSALDTNRALSLRLGELVD